MTDTSKKKKKPALPSVSNNKQWGKNRKMKAFTRKRGKGSYKISFPSSHLHMVLELVLYTKMGVG
jgi:hypothetical protein